MMLLLGWSLHQYAIAKAHHARITGEELPATMSGAEDLKVWWQMRRIDEPGQIKLIAVDPFLDLAWASKMFHNAAIECAPFMR